MIEMLDTYTGPAIGIAAMLALAYKMTKEYIKGEVSKEDDRNWEQALPEWAEWNPEEHLQSEQQFRREYEQNWDGKISRVDSGLMKPGRAIVNQRTVGKGK